MTNAALIEQLADLFRCAKAAAIAAQCDDSGGSSNFDTPIFRIERARDSAIKAAAELASVRVKHFEWLGRERWCFLFVMRGQGSCRSAMAKAATEVLYEAQKAGTIPRFRAFFFQMMD
jgi:hypothetical protein